MVDSSSTVVVEVGEALVLVEPVDVVPEVEVDEVPVVSDGVVESPVVSELLSTAVRTAAIRGPSCSSLKEIIGSAAADTIGEIIVDFVPLLAVIVAVPEILKLFSDFILTADIAKAFSALAGSPRQSTSK